MRGHGERIGLGSFCDSRTGAALLASALWLLTPASAQSAEISAQVKAKASIKVGAEVSGSASASGSVGTGAAPAARAESADSPARPEAPAPVISTGYAGVVPAMDTKNPLPIPDPSKVHLVWTGFRAVPGGSELFFQTTKPVQYELGAGGEGDSSKGRGGKKANKKDEGAGAGGLALTLRDCRIHLRNNMRDLDTHFFATPVARVSARARKGDITLRLRMKTPVEPAIRTEAGPDGSSFLVLAFPPHDAPPVGTAPNRPRGAVNPAGEPAAPESGAKK